MKAGTARLEAGGGGEDRLSLRALLLQWARQRPKDTVAGALAAFAAGAVLINALFLQPGPHPAPIFSNRTAAETGAPGALASLLLPRPRPGDAKAVMPAHVRPRADIIADIQRELTRRGFYDGPPDGIYGPKTDAAIRDFEEAAGLRPSAEPNDVLLATISRSSVRAKQSDARLNDPIADLLGPSRRIIAIQRALSDFGYGQIKPTGKHDADTRAAIERFERERKLPVTGQISDTVLRELSMMTGRPLE